MSGEIPEFPELPLVELTEDELRTIARDFVEHHGIEDEPELDDVFHHVVPVLHTTREEPCLPDQESVRRIESLIRRSQIAVQLPALLIEPQVFLQPEPMAMWARYFRAEYGAVVEAAEIRHGLSHAIVGEVAEATVLQIMDLIAAAQVRVQLPGDRGFKDAPYPAPEHPD